MRARGIFMLVCCSNQTAHHTMMSFEFKIVIKARRKKDASKTGQNAEAKQAMESLIGMLFVCGCMCLISFFSQQPSKYCAALVCGASAPVFFPRYSLLYRLCAVFVHYVPFCCH